MNKEYITPETETVEFNSPAILSGSDSRIKITQDNGGNEQLGRQQRNDWDNIWNR